MKKIIYIIAGTVIAFFLGMQLWSNPQTITTGSPVIFGLLPNPILTPGKADTLSLKDLQASYNGQTYSQSHRNVPESIKKQVMAEYSNPTGKIEIDHFYPLCAGGSNDITNLWPQPEFVNCGGKDCGFHTKDKLETYVCSQIKAGKLDPKTAYGKITSNWYAYYLELGLDKTLVSNVAGVVE